MKKILAYGLAGILLGGAFLWVEALATSEYERGKELFNDKCHLCHGQRGEGNGPAAVAFSPRPANFTDPKFWQNFSDAKIADTIRKGH